MMELHIPELAALREEIAALTTERDALKAEVERLREALTKIAWHDDPSYDHMVARAALRKDD